MCSLYNIFIYETWYIACTVQTVKQYFYSTIGLLGLIIYCARETVQTILQSPVKSSQKFNLFILFVLMWMIDVMNTLGTIFAILL